MSDQDRINGNSAPDPQRAAVARGKAPAEHLWLGCRLDAPACARGWIRQICTRHGLDDLIDDAALLVSEVVTSAVLNTRTECTVSADVDPHAVRVRVMKHGGTSQSTLPQHEYVESDLALMVLAALAADWGVKAEETGMTVWFTLDLTQA